jgi:hypothetical protein
MRLFMVLLVGVFLFLAGSMVTAQAGTVRFDENGVFYADYPSSPPGPWGGLYLYQMMFQNDWFGKAPGVVFNSLQTNLPAPPPEVILPVGPGGYLDVPVLEEGSSTHYSDVMRFYPFVNPSGVHWVRFFYYSEPEASSPSMADLSTDAWNSVINSLYIPPNLGDIPQESNGQFYWHSPYTGGNYYGWSEGIMPPPVPEPSTMLLLGSGLIGLAGYGRKKFFRK